MPQRSDREAAGIIGLAMVVEKCVEAGNDLPHPAAMIGLYFGILADHIDPDFAASLRSAFERTWAEASGNPAEVIEAQFSGAINQMVEAFRKV